MSIGMNPGVRDRWQRRRWLAAAAGLAGACWLPAHAQARSPLPPLDAPPGPDGWPPGWAHQTLPKVARTNRYDSVIAEDGARVLRVHSAAAASTLVARLGSVRLGAGATLQWRWRVSGAVPGSDLRVRTGDDYAARLYLLFDLPLERLALGDRLRLQAARALSGTDVPAAALCYVWGTAQPEGTQAPNPYTDRVRMVVLDSGDGHARQWRGHRRDIARDWRDAFGAGELPPLAAVAVGADTDNTGAEVTAWFAELVLDPGA
jgi:hypothetical protein